MFTINTVHKGHNYFVSSIWTDEEPIVTFSPDPSKAKQFGKGWANLIIGSLKGDGISSRSQRIN